jgi:DNA-binding protein YbaB
MGLRVNVARLEEWPQEGLRKSKLVNSYTPVGDLNAMRKQAAAIQQALEQEEFEVTEGTIRIVITGNQNVKLVEIDGVADDAMRRAMNDAIKRSQQAAAGKLAEMSKDMNLGQ